MVWFRWGCTASCGWNVRCVGVRGDAWSVLLSPCNTDPSPAGSSGEPSDPTQPRVRRRRAEPHNYTNTEKEEAKRRKKKKKNVRPCAQGRCGRCPPGSGAMSDFCIFFYDPHQRGHSVLVIGTARHLEELVDSHGRTASLHGVRMGRGDGGLNGEGVGGISKQVTVQGSGCEPGVGGVGARAAGGGGWGRTGLVRHIPRSWARLDVQIISPERPHGGVEASRWAIGVHN